MRLVPLVLAACCLGACESPDSRAKPDTPGERSSLLPGEFDPAMFDRLTDSRWELVSIQGRLVPLNAAARTPGIAFTRAGKVSGFAGINSFSGRTDPHELALGRLNLADVMSTLIGGPPEAMRTESEYLGALHRARSYTVSGDTLTLAGDDGRTLLTFRSQ